MSRSHRLLPADSLSDGESRAVLVEGRELAIFRIGDDYFALDNRCPHEGAPLNLGFTDGCAVVCALHNWKFDLPGGQCRKHRSSVATYPVRVEDGWVVVAMD